MPSSTVEFVCCDGKGSMTYRGSREVAPGLENKPGTRRVDRSLAHHLIGDP